MTNLDVYKVKTVSAKEAKQSFGQLLDDSKREPVRITKNGRQVAVVLSTEDYERLEALEDAHWVRLAEEARKGGYIGTKESDKLMNTLLNAKD